MCLTSELGHSVRIWDRNQLGEDLHQLLIRIRADIGADGKDHLQGSQIQRFVELVRHGCHSHDVVGAGEKGRDFESVHSLEDFLSVTLWHGRDSVKSVRLLDRDLMPSNPSIDESDLLENLYRAI